MMRLPFDEIVQTFEDILLSRAAPHAHAAKVAREVARNSLEGTYTHGVNRFARLVRNIDQGLIDTAQLREDQNLHPQLFRLKQETVRFAHLIGSETPIRENVGLLELDFDRGLL